MPAVEMRFGLTPAEAAVLYAAPEIQKLGNDAESPSYVDHPAVRYLAVRAGGEFLGAYQFVEATAYEIEIHRLMLNCSVRYSDAIAEGMHRAAFADPRVLRLSARVRDCWRTAVNHAVKHGWTVEGYKPSVVIDGGVIYGEFVLGFLRSAWEARQWVA